MYVPACDQALTVTGTGEVLCEGTLTLIDTTTLVSTFDLAQLDPAILSAAFGTGFILVASFEVAAWATAAILNFIDRR
jgi:hypothetical protein